MEIFITENSHKNDHTFKIHQSAVIFLGIL